MHLLPSWKFYIPVFTLQQLIEDKSLFFIV